MRTNGLVVTEKASSHRRSLFVVAGFNRPAPDLILDEPPSACQLIQHAPDAGEIFAVDAFCIVAGAVLAHEHGRDTQTLRRRVRTSSGGIVHTPGAAVITTQRLFRAGRARGGCRGGSIRQQDEQMPGRGTGVKADQIACRRRARPSRFQPDANTGRSPAGFVRNLAAPAEPYSPAGAEAADPHRDAAGGRLWARIVPCAAMTSPTVEPGSRSVQQQVHGEGGLISPRHSGTLGCRSEGERARPAPGPERRCGRSGHWALVDQNAVADLPVSRSTTLR